MPHKSPEARKAYAKAYFQKYKHTKFKEYRARPEIRDNNNSLRRRGWANGKYRKNRREHFKKWLLKPSNRILKRLRYRTWSALKGITKAESTLNLIGCSIEQLMEHIQKQFKPGMAWNNYGKGGWHIDHIKPCAKFNLLDPEEQKKCFHFTNLQPLWALENILKSDKYE